MTRRVWLSIAACAMAPVVACSGSGSDVQQTAFVEQSSGNLATVSLDQKTEWHCGDSDLQAVFTSTFNEDALVAAIKAAIADPNKPDASFSFVGPIESFYTSFPDHALCMSINGATNTPEADALVDQLRSTGNVESIRRR